ncbi:MAG: nuclear transport factor 2 family protein [Actinomycetota bacterium]
MSVKSVLDHHMESLLAGDVDAVMEDYDDDAVLITAGMGTAEGAAAIRTSFEMIPAEMFDGFEITEEVISGEAAMITWKSNALSFGTDTFWIRDDKILTQTVAFQA